jgi:hypothetical protein
MSTSAVSDGKTTMVCSSWFSVRMDDHSGMSFCCSKSNRLAASSGDSPSGGSGNMPDADISANLPQMKLR